MDVHAIVFDFDGTLIESNQLKFDAYFKLFPRDARHAQIIQNVVSGIYEQSRFIILEEILRRLGNPGKADLKRQVQTLAARYNQIVAAGAKTCPEKTGAERALNRLVKTRHLYVSSTTPETELKEIIRYRKWDGYFRDIFGYPRKKADTLLRILSLERLDGDQIIVIGDGDSDRQAATHAGCPFIQVTEGFRFDDIDHAIESLWNKGPSCPARPREPLLLSHSGNGRKPRILDPSRLRLQPKVVDL
jgi:phosphoglycolate phosphatase-like HAD superfamily hydrolase